MHAPYAMRPRWTLAAGYARDARFMKQISKTLVVDPLPLFVLSQTSRSFQSTKKSTERKAQKLFGTNFLGKSKNKVFTGFTSNKFNAYVSTPLCYHRRYNNHAPGPPLLFHTAYIHRSLTSHSYNIPTSLPLPRPPHQTPTIILPENGASRHPTHPCLPFHCDHDGIPTNKSSPSHTCAIHRRQCLCHPLEQYIISRRPKQHLIPRHHHPHLTTRKSHYQYEKCKLISKCQCQRVSFSACAW